MTPTLTCKNYSDSVTGIYNEMARKYGPKDRGLGILGGNEDDE